MAYTSQSDIKNIRQVQTYQKKLILKQKELSKAKTKAAKKNLAAEIARLNANIKKVNSRISKTSKNGPYKSNIDMIRDRATEAEAKEFEQLTLDMLDELYLGLADINFRNVDAIPEVTPDDSDDDNDDGFIPPPIPTDPPKTVAGEDTEKPSPPKPPAPPTSGGGKSDPPKDTNPRRPTPKKMTVAELQTHLRKVLQSKIQENIYDNFKILYMPDGKIEVTFVVDMPDNDPYFTFKDAKITFLV